MPHRLQAPTQADTHSPDHADELLGVPRRSKDWLPRRAGIGYAVAVAAVLLIALSSVMTLDARRQAADQLNASAAASERVADVLASVVAAESGQRGYLLTGEDGYLEPYTAGRAETDASLGMLRQLLAGDVQQMERLADAERLVAAKFAELQETIDLRSRGQLDNALNTVRSNRGKQLMDRLREVLADIGSVQGALKSQRQQAWQTAADSSLWAALGGAAVLLTLLAFAAWMTSLYHRQQEDEVWMRSSQAALARQIQGEQRLDVLTDRVLGFLARALSARVGVMYVADGNGLLQRTAGYALAEGTAPETLRPGQGLLGEAAKADTPLRLSGVPADHLPVTSATGRSAALELLVAPARYEGQLQAVIELGFHQRVDATAVALLDRVSQALAIAVRSSRDRTRLEVLLEETQRQAEELQAQQEELRVSNEELDEQSRVLRESQATLESQQTELERSNAQLSQHAATLEHQQRALLQSQEALQAQSDELAAASRYKSEFLANMSHELRTPLNSALILSQLLIENKGGQLSTEQVRFAQSIHDANNDLLLLINDVLDLSKIVAGHVDLQAETVRLSDVAQRLRTVFEPMARHRGLGLDIQLAEDAPATLQTDGQRLQQVLKNLVSNALKFTREGEVTVTIAADPEGGPGSVRIDVRDTGLGIAADKHDVIFEAFRQADGSTSRQFGGTGLGLSISRELVQRLGGRMGLVSAPGEGSTFTVWLPPGLPEATDTPTAQVVHPNAIPASQAPSKVRTGAASTPPTAPDPVPRAMPPRDPSRRMLLAVEDDGRFAEVLQRLVQEQGFDCMVASNGEQALEMAVAMAPSGILLDVGLPDQSGLAVLERLKREPRTRHIPVHLVSSQERSQAAMELGAIGHLVKPAQRDQLVAAIQLLEDKLNQPMRQVLVVEDDPVLRDSLQQLLAGPQVQITTVGTVADALQSLGQTTFDCMVTDLNMPDGTGFDLLEGMSAGDSLGFPPVIVYTGRALSRDEEVRLRRHSRSIIVKGARSPERLLDEVTLFLHSVESQLPPEQRRLLEVARSRDSALDGRCILLAEDDVRNIFALDSVFAPRGVKLEVARNGREALDKVASGLQVDLVLMDVMMPEMDGLEATRRIRALPGMADLPIIALTAKAMADDRQQCLQAGANDYMAKPIDVERLLSLCRVWMPK
jgi:CheY-like chemotaxis protein/signal transduction histidine kinase/CHASE3 domain sensor protein